MTTTVQERLDEAHALALAEGQANTETWMKEQLGVAPDDWEWCGNPTLFYNDSSLERKHYLIGPVRVYGMRYRVSWFVAGEFLDKHMMLKRTTKQRPWIIPNKQVRFHTRLALNADLAVHPDRVSV